MAIEASQRPDLLERLRALPGGEQLLGLSWPDRAFLVGGAVRDLLLGRAPRELDVVVEGDAHGYAMALAGRIGADCAQRLHERFETATVRLGDVRVDIAAARAERYEFPGALPTVAPAPLAEDLARRDFTVNAIALALGPGPPGELLALAGALADLETRQLRVLHERSFSDDPTRLLRLARYEVRLGFAADPATEDLARRALWEGSLAHVSGARLGSELRLALAEADPAAVLARFAQQGLLGGLHPRLRFDGELYGRARELLDGDGCPGLLALAVLVLPLTIRADGHPRGEEARALLDRLEFHASARDPVLRAALALPRLLEELEPESSPSTLRGILAGVPVEGVALAGAMMGGEGLARARRWLHELRFVRLRIDGDDLLSAGVPQGPEIGKRLAEVLDMRLDGRVADEREAQLEAALAVW